MNWYKEYRSEWKEIIETVARELGRTELMVEKDTIQSMFLLELSKLELPFVFKGGTSLSKAYNLIERFSEDIDLSMNTLQKVFDNCGMSITTAGCTECIDHIAVSKNLLRENTATVYEWNQNKNLSDHKGIMITI